MNSKFYKYCIVPQCGSTTIKTPNKLFIYVPHIETIRRHWLKCARLDSKEFSSNTRMYFCEDHFDLENDMENYRRYKLMGSVKTIRMNRDCVPSRFDCQANNKRKSMQSKTQLAFIKKQKKSMIKELKENLHHKHNEVLASSCKESQVEENNSYLQNNPDKKAVEMFPSQDQKACIVNQMVHKTSNQAQIRIKTQDGITSLPATICTDPSSCKIFEGNMNMPSTSTLSNPKSEVHLFIKKEYDNSEPLPSDNDVDPTIAGITDDVSSSYKLSIQTETITDNSSQDEFKKLEKINLKSTLSKIKKKPQFYIGLPKEHYFVIDLIKNRTSVSEENILLCLMRIKLNRTYSELADDFDCSVTEARHIFFIKLPEIVEVLSDFIQHPSSETVKNNVPVTVICIIDCLEIELQRPKKSFHQTLTWSDSMKTNTIKYLIACTPDGDISFVSTGYAGTITYVNMVEHSKFLDSLQPGAFILANKGFKNIEHYLSQKGFNLLRPASVSNLSKAALPQGKDIANLRTLANRVIRRLREFGMLKMHSVIKMNLIDMLDSCVTTACALINLRNTNEKFCQ